MKTQVRNHMGQSVARICTTRDGGVYVSMGIEAYQGTDLTQDEAEQLVSALQIALAELQLKKGGTP